MQILNARVRHATFGAGQVCRCSDSLVEVRFADGVRRFCWPDAFESYLTLEDPHAQAEWQAAVRQREAEELRQQAELHRRIQQARLLRSLPCTGSDQAALNGTWQQAAEAVQEGRIFTGTYLSGQRRGQPRIPQKVMPNSACVLTWLPKNEPESRRRVAALCLPQTDFIGAECTDGFILLHPQHRLLLPEDSAFYFWDYAAQEPCPTQWGRSCIRYFANESAGRLLLELCRQELCGPKSEALWERHRDLNQL